MATTTASGEERLEAFPNVPRRLAGLVDLAYNLWWSWHPEARVLFKKINQQAWKNYIHNPVRMLRDVPPEFFDLLLNNPEYLHRYDIIMNRFNRYMATNQGWFAERYSLHGSLPIAYFSAEYGLHHSLPFYAGGLGFLAGDHLKECSDLGVPLVAVGFMYSEGYLHQHILPDGWQDNITEMVDRTTAPITRVLDAAGDPVVVRVPFIGPPISVEVWKVNVGKVPLYLLDTDIRANDPEYRTISHRLYTEQTEQRLRQEIVLGIGGRKVLSDLGIAFSAVHLNEGHPAFTQLERIRERVGKGMTFENALLEVRATSVFTTHTPVPAGNDIFPPDLMDTYFSGYYPTLGIDRDTFYRLGQHPCDQDGGFNMTAFALRTAAYHNGVSKRHGEVARKMWQCLWPEVPEESVPIDHITNGVHMPTWLNPRMEDLFSRYFDAADPHWQINHDNPAIWQMIDEIPDKELWEVHVWLKQKLFNRIRERKRIDWETGQKKPGNLIADGLMLNPSILTIGFARRFSSYKRADLILQDPARLARILNDPWHPVQLIFAGKAHPADYEGKMILKRIYEAAQDPAFGGRIGFVEDYGEQTAQYMVHGVDVWMNNPVPPLEACGTSGMKASLNGVLNLSILDGWWPEGYNGRNGWAFSSGILPGTRNADDAAALYTIIEKEVVPLYYAAPIDGIPHGWVKMMKASIRSNSAQFSARRMVKEYVAKYYPSVLTRTGSECRFCAPE